MKWNRIHRPRWKGTVETFMEDSSVLAEDSGLTVATMQAFVERGNAVTITEQTFDSTRDELQYVVNFVNPGQAIVQVKTTYQGVSETTISSIAFRTQEPYSYPGRKGYY